MARPVSGPGDGILVDAVLRGEVQCYQELVERHQAGMFRVAMSMVHDSDVAADLVQDALVKAYTSLAECRDPAKFKSWAYRILTNAARDYLKSRRQRDVSLTEELAGETRAGPADEFERRHLRDAISTALSTLPDAQREAFVLKHVEGWGYDEMAETLGDSVSALKMRVMRAREALQHLLSSARDEV